MEFFVLRVVLIWTICLRKWEIVFILKAILKIIELISILIFLFSKNKKIETKENEVSEINNSLAQTSNDLT